MLKHQNSLNRLVGSTGCKMRWGRTNKCILCWKSPAHWICMLDMLSSSIRFEEIPCNWKKTAFLKNTSLRPSREYFQSDVKTISSEEFVKHFPKFKELKWSYECWNDTGRQLGGLGGRMSANKQNNHYLKAAFRSCVKWNCKPYVVMRCNHIFIPRRNDSIENKAILNAFVSDCGIIWVTALFD